MEQTKKQNQEVVKSDSGELEAIADRIKSLAQKHEGNAVQLLEILRVLESLHSQICNDLFQPAMPDSRHALFDLLRNIEANGGWPYIYRIKLKDLLQNLEASDLANLQFVPKIPEQVDALGKDPSGK
ncbi:hypothetical protein TUMEXPCC7403_06830 [Tumidithrix helvetica PCC 7403]|uniref:hypothetical protein n=1 Tax=Tumidithrix helvetica TaxID=3457545 RepID=UPI003C8E6DC0